MVFAQHGKDLSAVDTVLLTGGALIHSADPAAIGAFAGATEDEPYSLRPRNARTLVDVRYILPSMGLLSAVSPETALCILQRELLPAAPAGS